MRVDERSPEHPGIARRRLTDGEDLLVREEPLWIQVGEARLLTMRTPGRDEDLATGFLFGEGVLRDIDELTDLSWEAGDPEALRPDTVSATLRGDAVGRVEGRLTRTHEVRPSCALCGLTDVDQLLEDLPPLLPGVPKFRATMIHRLQERFHEVQQLFDHTGASHAAALFDVDGNLLAHGEDVGRHNALDKAIGQALRARVDLTRCLAMLSGRAGYDLVLKSLRARIPVILSVSAPSALAFDVCDAAGATLIGFVRKDRHKVYSGPERITS